MSEHSHSGALEDSSMTSSHLKGKLSEGLANLSDDSSMTSSHLKGKLSEGLGKLSDDLGKSTSLIESGMNSSKGSWLKKQSESDVIKRCRSVFDSLQNIPEKSELQSHIFTLEKAVQQIYTSRVEGNAKVFQSCSQVVSELESACTLFELELPKHIAELKVLAESLTHHSEVTKTGFLWRFTQFLSSSTHKRIKEFTKYLNQSMEIQKALQLRLVVHAFSQWNARAANHLVSGTPLNKLLLVTFRLRKLSIPERLREELDEIEDHVHEISEFLPQDDEGFEDYLSNCRDCTAKVSKVLDSIIAGKDAFNVQQDEIDSCLSQMKLLRQTNTTMEETPKAAIAVIEALQDILVSMNQINVLVRGMQAFFKIKLRQKESLNVDIKFMALFSLLLVIMSVLILIAGVVLLILGLLQKDKSMTSIGIAMLGSTLVIYFVIFAVAQVKKRKAKQAIMPLASKLPVKVTMPVKDVKKKLKGNVVAPLKENLSAMKGAIIEEVASELESGSPSKDAAKSTAQALLEKAAAGTSAENLVTQRDIEKGGKDEVVPGGEVDEEMLKEEVLRYAVHLGMDPQEDTDLFWIAEQAYHAHLPPNWAQYADDKGNLYYYNKLTGISSWNHPLEDQFRSLYAQMKASKEKFGSMVSVQQQQTQGVPFNPQRFLTSDSAFTSDNESEYESEGSRFETSRDSLSSSFVGSYFSSLRSPREEHSDLNNSMSEKIHNRSYTSGVTGKSHLGVGEGSSVNLEHIPRSKFSESSPAFIKKQFARERLLDRSSENIPISARPPPSAFLASLSDSSAGHSMQKALKNIMSNM